MAPWSVSGRVPRSKPRRGHHHEVAGRRSPMVALPSMAQAARKATKKKARQVRIYTAWHPLVVVLLSCVLPEGWYRLLSEFQLAREPLRVDIVIVRRSRPGAPPAPHLLTSVVGELAEHTLVHFKGPTDELERDDAWMLLAYVAQYVVVAGVEDPADVALRVVAPRLTPRFVEALRSLGCALTTTGEGTHEGKLGVFPLRVIETVRVNARAGEHLLYTVTPGMLADPDGFPTLTIEENEVMWALREHVEQLRHPLPGVRRRHMKDEDKVVKSFDRAMASLLARLPPEQRLAGLAPEQRLAGLAPEQRLAGLTEAQAVLALPDAMLRALSHEYLATLPSKTRAAIQRRLGGSAGARRAPARRRKTHSRAG
jgi:hypothetical protein